MNAFADFRYAIRSLRKRPGFCALAIVTLALGSAGASALLSFVGAWIVRPISNVDTNRTLFLRSMQAPQGKQGRVSLPDFRDWQANNKSFSAMALYDANSFTLQSDTVPEIVAGASATNDMFSILGARMELGRGFRPSEEVYGAHYSAVVSHGFWKTRLGGTPDALGKALKLDGQTYTVVGVLAESFHYPIVGRVNIWTPLALSPADAEKRNSRFYDALAALKPGVTLEQAREDLKQISSGMAERYPTTNKDIGPQVKTLGAEIGLHTGNDKVLVLLAVSVGLMLIACSNVGNLLLVRAFGRRREAAIQISLGAGKGRMIGQALAESLLLFGVSAGVSILAGKWLTDWVSAAIPASNRGYLPNYGVVTLDWAIISTVLGFSLLCGLAFGVGPALEGMRVDLATMLKDGSASSTSGSRQGRLRSAMVVGQVLLATLLLVITGVMVQNFSNLWTRDPGFVEDNLLSFRVSLDARHYADAVARTQFVDGALASLSSLPQIGRPAAARFIPYGQSGGGTTILVEGRGEQDVRKAPTSAFNSVSSSFFETLRNPILAGRVFEDRDNATAPPVVVVNDAVARELFPDRSPLGQRLIIGRFKNRVAEIIGVVKEIHDRTDLPLGQWQIYVPQPQSPSTEVSFVIHAKSDPTSLAAAARKLVADIDRNAPVHDIKTLPQRSAEQFAPYRILCQMVAGFGLLALLMAAVGVYGVISFATSQRTKELGIRVALGADRRDVVRLILNRGVRLVLFGLIPGIALAIAASKALQSVMPEIERSDPWIFIGTSVALGLVGACAALIPALRAARVDPLTALRME